MHPTTGGTLRLGLAAPAVSLAALTGAVAYGQDLIANPGFEQGSTLPPGCQSVNAAIGQWNTTLATHWEFYGQIFNGSGILQSIGCWAGACWPSGGATGTRSAVLGTTRQYVTGLTPGSTYRLSFSFFPDCNACYTKTVTVQFGASIETRSVGCGCNCVSAPPGWSRFDIEFQASASEQWLRFDAGGGNACTGCSRGWLDDVTLVPVIRDCNSNGVPDEDDLASGGADNNQDGVLDECQCLADVNSDGFVNGADLAAVLSQWGTPGTAPHNADLNGSGLVDGKDLATVLSAWGPCP